MSFPRNITQLLSIFLFVFFFNVCSAAEVDKNPVQTTRDFYTSYMDDYFKMIPPDAGVYREMMKKYVTKRFNEEIKEAKVCEGGSDPVCTIDGVEPKLGYVYIIRAQDAYEDWTSIEVQENNSNSEVATVKVSLGGVKEVPQIILVSLIKDGGQWKIDNVSDLKPAPYRFQ